MKTLFKYCLLPFILISCNEESIADFLSGGTFKIISEGKNYGNYIEFNEGLISCDNLKKLDSPDQEIFKAQNDCAIHLDDGSLFTSYDGYVVWSDQEIQEVNPYIITSDSLFIYEEITYDHDDNLIRFKRGAKPKPEGLKVMKSEDGIITLNSGKNFIELEKIN